MHFKKDTGEKFIRTEAIVMRNSIGILVEGEDDT